MRFLMVSIFYPPYSFGGDAIYLQRLCRELAARGHQVDVVHCADSFRFFGKEAQPDCDPPEGVTVHRLESAFPKLGPLLAHQLGRPLLHERALRRLFVSKPFDVVHFHNISLLGPRVLQIPVPAGARKVYTAHEHWLICPLSVLWKFGEKPCDSPECFRCQLRAGRPPQLWRRTGMLRRAAAQVDLFLASSRFSIEMHRSRGFEAPMELLAPFVAPVAGSEGPSPHPRPFFFFAGRLEKYKGLETILPAFAGDGEFDLLAAGDGPELEPLRRLAARHPRVKLLGWLADDRLADYYRHALAAIVPSTGYETFGLVAIEAMAHGAPVIARRLGPLPEIVEQSGGGVLFDTTDELAAHCRAIARDAALRERLAAAGRACQQRHWTAQGHVERYLKLLAGAQDENVPLEET